MAGHPIDRDREEKSIPKAQAQQPVPTAMEATSVLPGSLPEASGVVFSVSRRSRTISPAEDYKVYRV